MPERPLLPYGRQWIDEEDIAAVVEALRSDWLTQGPAVARFEERVREYTGARYAVAVANGTAGLHLACLAAGLGPGDEVLTSTNSFVASANCALYCGARPVLLDIDPATLNLSPRALAAHLDARTGGARVVIPVHFAGRPCDMDAIGELAAAHGFVVIEDACHAIGASRRDAAGAWQRIGRCDRSDMAVFSFHPVKQMTTGEGGMVLTNREDLYRRLLALRSHGITREPTDFELPEQAGPWYYEMQELGFNYRITDLQCALGSSQLDKLEGFLARRRAIAARYNEAFADLPRVELPREHDGTRSAWHLYVLQADFAALGRDRPAVMQALRTRGVGTQVHYIPIHLQPYYRRLGYRPGQFPAAEAYYARTLSLPLFPAMGDEDVGTVIAAVRETLTPA